MKLSNLMSGPLPSIRSRWRPGRGAPRATPTGAGPLTPGLPYYLLASTPFVVVFAIIPLGLHAHSGEEWSFAADLLLRLAALGPLAFLAAAVALRLLAVRFVEASRALAIGLFCLGAWMLLAQVYAPVAIGPLDGGEMRSDEPLSYTLLEAVLLVGAAVLFGGLWRGRGLAMAQVFAAALWLVAGGYLFAALWPADEAGAEVARSDTEALAAPRSCGVDGNVYHLVLDKQQTDAVLQAVHDNRWAAEFAGFDLFSNNISNYLITGKSMASYLTGTFYHSGDVGDWATARAEGLFRNLAGHDFGIWLYGPLKSWNNGYVDVFRSNLDVYRARTGALDGEFYDFLSVWLTSLAPNGLTEEAIPVAADLASRLFTVLTVTREGDWGPFKGKRLEGKAHLRNIGFHPVASTFLLDQVALDEPARPPTCEYVYAHAILPHDPLVVDGQCRYVGRWRARPEKIGGKRAYLQQTECALRKVIEFVHVLKRLDRFDAATVVVHGDHGSTLRFRTSRDLSGVAVLGWPRAALLSRALALLMIKRPHARHPFEIVERPTQLVDVYPTIFDLAGLGLPPGAVHGRSIYAAAQPPREARFALDPKERYGPDLVEVRIDDPRHLATSNLTVVGPATDPALWRAEVRAAEKGTLQVSSGSRPR